MGQLRSASRAFATQSSGPADLLDALQTNWERLGLDRMATAIAARSYPATGEVVIASAGHLPPILVSGDTAVALPVEPGPPLGAPGGAPVTEWCGEMPSGAVLLCYTDGLVEDRHQDIDVGLGELLEACRETGERDVDSFCNAVVKAMVGGERSDDIAVLAARRG
jgi:serine/threonine-protein kinase RsbW